VIAPCGHGRPCPLLREDVNPEHPYKPKKDEFCHFVQNTARLLRGTKEEQNYGLRVNYSYVAIRKQLHSEKAPLPALRVLSKPEKHVRHVIVNVCSPSDGYVKKTVPYSDREHYRTARKVQWGDLIDLRSTEK